MLEKFDIIRLAKPFLQSLMSSVEIDADKTPLPNMRSADKKVLFRNHKSDYTLKTDKLDVILAKDEGTPVIKVISTGNTFTDA